MQSKPQLIKKQELGTQSPHKEYLMQGQYCTVETVKWDLHARNLFENIGDPELWTFVPPEKNIQSPEELTAIFSNFAGQFYVIRKKGEDDCVGLFGLVNVNIDNQSVQLGKVVYSKKVQRSVMTTQAFYLITKYTFQTLNFNRYHWMCNFLNEPSKRAATRLGFKFEAVQREQGVFRNRYRSRTHYSMLRRQWPAIKVELERWLSKDNFDQDGRQLTKLRLRQVRQLLDEEQTS